MAGVADSVWSLWSHCWLFPQIFNFLAGYEVLSFACAFFVFSVSYMIKWWCSSGRTVATIRNKYSTIMLFNLNCLNPTPFCLSLAAFLVAPFPYFHVCRNMYTWTCCKHLNLSVCFCSWDEPFSFSSPLLYGYVEEFVFNRAEIMFYIYWLYHYEGYWNCRYPEYPDIRKSDILCLDYLNLFFSLPSASLLIFTTIFESTERQLACWIEIVEASRWPAALQEPDLDNCFMLECLLNTV